MRRTLAILFGLILVAMLSVTTWASLRIPIWNAGPDVSDPWSVATLFDAYAGFVTFYVWVAYKESKLSMRILWFVNYRKAPLDILFLPVDMLSG